MSNLTHKTIIVGSTVVFALIVIIYFLTHEATRHDTHHEFIDGYWEASTAFCSRSGVDSAQALFRDGRVYLLISDGQDMVLNKCVAVRLTPKWWAAEGAVSTWMAHFAEDVTPLPQSCEVRFDPKVGMLGFFEGETLYLELFKNTKASAGIV